MKMPIQTSLTDSPRSFVLTGSPGSGKTAILRQLEVLGYSVVEEAATDVIALQQAQGIAEPWTHPTFLEAIVSLQRRRRLAPARPGIQFHDRSVFCTAALATYLGFPLPTSLLAEMEAARPLFEPTVFFLRNLGFVEPTEARRISYEEALRFEVIHEETYLAHGFELDYLEAADLATRVAVLLDRIDPQPNF